jgi:adenylosuccinate synthase
MRVTIVVGGQYGSEGKGNVAGWLHGIRKYDWGVRVGGPNAGHTVYDRSGNKYALRQIPVAAAVDPDCKLQIAEGSEIDQEVLRSEITLLEAKGHNVADRLYISPEATMITGAEKDAEGDMPHGSTQKGIGAARAARCMRTAKLSKDLITGLPSGAFQETDSILIEGTQGFALGSHAGYYPHCTSGDCRAIDFAAQAGISLFSQFEVWVVLRTFPIRIAGNSGPLPHEKSWEQIGVPPEYTTVTKKMRRVGGWDQELASAAVQANGGDRVKVALTFADYWWPEIKDEDDPLALSHNRREHLRQLQWGIGAPICMVGTGPNTFINLGPEGA